MAKIICLKIKRRGDFFRLGAQILRRFMGFYSFSGEEAVDKDEMLFLKPGTLRYLVRDVR